MDVRAAVLTPSARQACGPLSSLKRVNKAFGFATFVDADGVLRALEHLNGKELPSMGDQSGEAPKALSLKADAKTAKFLEQYEQGRTVVSLRLVDHQRTACG
jgi:hypothetical protein